MDFRPARFEVLPPVVKNIMIINGMFFLATILIGRQGIDISRYLALHYWSSDKFGIWQLVTHLFMHGDVGGPGAIYSDGFMHLFSNMFALWMFGSVLEKVFGPKRFLSFYLMCGIGASLLHLGVVTYELNQIPDIAVRMNLENNMSMVGASGAVFGILFAFGYLFPNTELYIYFIPVPIKAKYLVGFYALFELYAGIRNSAGDNIAHFAHIGGMLVAFIIIKVWNRTNRTTLY